MNWNEIFDYIDGSLYWKVARKGHRLGVKVGSLDKNGYWVICFDRKRYKRHRVVYEMFNGEIPDGLMVRHINGVRGDDRPENLTIGTNRDNQYDRTRVGLKWKTNKSGVTGVCFATRRDRWLASAYDHTRHIHLGYYADWFDAVCARKSWEVKNIS